MSPFLFLLHRELIRFLRQPARMIASIGTPALVWLLLGAGFSRAVFAAPTSGPAAADGAAAATGYAAYLPAGMAAMGVVFTSIFAAMSLIEDRNEGFLQTVLVSPAPTWSMVAAKVVGSAVVAVLQAVPIVLAAPLAGVALSPLGFLSALLALALMALGVTGLGLAAAWRVNSTAGFHGVMNLVLMPMLLLSGAFFPIAGAAGWLAWLMALNPLLYPVAALRHALESHPASIPEWLGAAAFAAGGAGLAWVVMGRGRDPSARRSAEPGASPVAAADPRAQHA